MEPGFRLVFFNPKYLLFGDLVENLSVALLSPACLLFFWGGGMRGGPDKMQITTFLGLLSTFFNKILLKIYIYQTC